jgi:hypothetical protein
MTPVSASPKIYDTFHKDWYYAEYASTIEKLRLKNETLIEFYLRIGARLGHDPEAEFSEILYRINNPDVYRHLLANAGSSGYMHYLEFGHLEPSRFIPSQASIELTRKICKHLDPEFLQRSFKIDSSKYISPLDFYFLNVRDRRLSPSAFFSEEAYRHLNPDVDESVIAGNFPSGFAHYIYTLNTENRPCMSVHEYVEKTRSRNLETNKNALEANFSGVTNLHAFEFLDAVAFYTRDIAINLVRDPKPGMLAIVPNFLPEIIFGGYISFFAYLSALKDKANIDLKLLILNRIPKEINKWNIMRMRVERPEIVALFSSIDYLTEDRSLSIPSSFSLISYCAETHYTANLIGNKLGSTPYFFIQEYEPDFHPKGDFHTFVRNAFFLPHFGIYNSKALLRYFIEEVGMQAAHGDEYRYSCIENYVDRIAVSWEVFKERHENKEKRKLIFYGRPEAHATRNHFGTFVLGLRLAIEKGYFEDSNWEFVSIGSLVHEGNIPIADGHKLKIITKLPYKEYMECVQTGDIGVSFISTPHQGIVHFQMANYGLVTITNTTKEKGAKWLSSINSNIMAAELFPERIAEALRVAVQRSSDLGARYENACDGLYSSRADCLLPAVNSVMTQMGLQPVCNAESFSTAS